VDRDIVDKLKNVSIFEYVKDEPEALEKFSEIMEMCTYRSGSTIIQEGEEGSELFILYKGTVEITKDTLAKDRYTVTKLSAENNAFFGELALIDNDSRSASVIAKTDCELLIIKKISF
jgi:CRP/FNR family cyclic AMP-dependent transcriptional regulator